ncbi:MAG: COG2907: Amine oxidase, flavin-containing [uncultured Thiotrichaceae bacterium]|uniref:COG2907: Amine oxidase, flavin-containing n=1 Tax=uncultured Thiotrichaceae bacterium TaxID=298394 RepID=A0A6S6UI64_9GAMM|nr:MAG: COG2907: Amine oxidase, flavin-containing [uncultured Thiotrichaceae bacterium]
MNTQRVAIIGSGITGLSSCWLLHDRYDVTLFEKNDYIGGHTNTIDVYENENRVPVDTGFIVYNEKNYPNLIGLFEQLGVQTQKTDMSFAFSLNHGELEYSGSGIKGLFAQHKNWFSPGHWRLLKEILRFNRLAHVALEEENTQNTMSLGEFLHHHHFSSDMINHYLLPMGAAIWSCPVDTMLKFPVRSFLQFFANHGLIDIKNRPQWRSVVGGSSEYVKNMLAKMEGKVTYDKGAIGVSRSEDQVKVKTVDGVQEFDKVIFACHADQALALLEQPDDAESEILSAFQYEENRTYLHTDLALMPKRKSVWSSWNYLASSDPESQQQMTATYWMNNLQRFENMTDYLVTLNPFELPKDEKIITEICYEHPVFDQKAIQAQAQLSTLQGNKNSWFCGSYSKYGFHEDALSSAVAVCGDFGVTPVWKQTSINKGSDKCEEQVGKQTKVLTS